MKTFDSVKPALSARALGVAALAACVAGCASIDAIPLKPDGSKLGDDVVSGIRYYLPKPYLLITELPASSAPAVSSDDAAGGAGAGKTDSSQKSSDAPSQASTPTAASTDTSFSAAMAQYAVKLVYLPDYAHPMALRVNTGLLGTANVAPTLTDGWMLSSMNGSADSGVAATLQALTGFVSGGGAGGAKGSSGKGSASGSGDKGGAKPEPAKSRDLALDMTNAELQLYAKDVVANKRPAPTQEKLAAFYPTDAGQKFIAKLISFIALADAAAAKDVGANAVAWGRAVLPPGLYEIEYSDVVSDAANHAVGGGKLVGLKPVVYFCKNGPLKPDPSQAVLDAQGHAMPFTLEKTPCVHD